MNRRQTGTVTKNGSARRKQTCSCSLCFSLYSSHVIRGLLAWSCADVSTKDFIPRAQHDSYLLEEKLDVLGFKLSTVLRPLFPLGPRVRIASPPGASSVPGIARW